MAIYFNKIHEVGSDETCGYNVVFPDVFTVNDFINHILLFRQDEWGSIFVNDMVIDYNRGSVILPRSYSLYRDKVVMKIFGASVRSAINYKIILKDEDI